MDPEKITPTVVETPMSLASMPSPTSPTTPNNRNSLYTWQTLVGDIDARAETADQAETLYHEIIHQQRKARVYYFLAGFAVYFMIALQVTICLGITIGAQLALTRDTISILAGVNTGVAATIGVFKGLGMPERKGIQRIKLSKMADRIRLVTRKLRAGLDVDVEAEADEVRKVHDELEDEQITSLTDLGKLAVDGLNEGKK